MNPDCDAIIIPGGGVRDGGELPPWVRQRLDRAVELYRGQFIISASAGTTYRPTPLDAAGYPIFESTASAKYLIEAGVPPDSILRESCSYDTIGNAYFSRVIHTEPRKLRRLLVITSDFHLARTEAVFSWIFNLTPTPIEYELHFEGVDDSSMDREVLRLRREKERASLSGLPSLLARFTELQDFHRWFFAEHGAYRSQPIFQASLDELTMQSY